METTKTTTISSEKLYKVDFLKGLRILSEYIPSYMECVVMHKSITLKHSKAKARLTDSIATAEKMLANFEEWQTRTDENKNEISKAYETAKNKLDILEKKIAKEKAKAEKYMETEFFAKLSELSKEINNTRDVEKAVKTIVEWFNTNAFTKDYDLTKTEFKIIARNFISWKDTKTEVLIEKNQTQTIDGTQTINRIVKYMYESMCIIGTIKAVNIPENLLEDYNKKLEERKAKEEEKAKIAKIKAEEKDIKNRQINAKKKADAKIKGKK